MKQDKKADDKRILEQMIQEKRDKHKVKRSNSKKQINKFWKNNK